MSARWTNHARASAYLRHDAPEAISACCHQLAFSVGTKPRRHGWPLTVTSCSRWTTSSSRFLGITPADLDGGKADWALALAEVSWLRRDLAQARSYGELASAGYAHLLEGWAQAVDREQVMIPRAYGLAYAGRTNEAIGEAERALALERQLGLRNAYLPLVFARIMFWRTGPSRQWTSSTRRCAAATSIHTGGCESIQPLRRSDESAVSTPRKRPAFVTAWPSCRRGEHLAWHRTGCVVTLIVSSAHSESGSSPLESYVPTFRKTSYRYTNRQSSVGSPQSQSPVRVGNPSRQSASSGRAAGPIEVHSRMPNREGEDPTVKND